MLFQRFVKQYNLEIYKHKTENNSQIIAKQIYFASIASDDTRTNQNMMLVSIHIVWLREQKRLIYSYLIRYII